MPEHRIHRLQIRVTTAERKWLETQAAGSRQSISAYVRERLGVESAVAHARRQRNPG
jgi:uncharacterized protein (DUF1778 family)